MTLMERRINYITRQKLAVWIEGMQNILNEAKEQGDLAGEGVPWVETHFAVLQSLANEGMGEYTKWLKTKCSCGVWLLAKDDPMYGVYLYHDHFTISCICGKTHQFKYQLVEAPIEIPF